MLRHLRGLYLECTLILQGPDDLARTYTRVLAIVLLKYISAIAYYQISFLSFLKKSVFAPLAEYYNVILI